MHSSKPWEIPVRDFILVVYLLVPPAYNFTILATSLDNYFVKHISVAASGYWKEQIC